MVYSGRSPFKVSRPCTAVSATPSRASTSAHLLVGSYVAALATAAACLAYVALEANVGFGPVLPIAILASLCIYAESQPVRLSSTTELSVSFLPFVFAAVIFGPLAAMAVGALGLVGEFKPPYLRWATWTTTRVLVGGLTGGVALMIQRMGGTTFGWLLLCVAAAALTESFSDVVLTSVVPVLRGTGTFMSVPRTTWLVTTAAMPLVIPVIAVLAYAYIHISTWTVVLFLLPSFAAQRLFILYREQRDTSQELAMLNGRLAQANLSFATALVATLDARDQYTSGHSAAVALYSRDIAARLGLAPGEQRLAEVCGLVHDIGKIGLPPGLLEKAGPLTLEERRTMEQHSQIGARILANVEDYSEIADIVRHHHERVDGRGYPHGLVGNAIPLMSRIVSVADAYDAMTSDRPYRDAMPSHIARARLAQAAGSQFDASIVNAFDAVLSSAPDAYRLGTQFHTPAAQQSGQSVAVAAVG